MYPIIQKENENFIIIGITTITQLSCCDAKEHERIKNKNENDMTNHEKKILKLKPLNKIPQDFNMGKYHYYEDGKFKEGNE